MTSALLRGALRQGVRITDQSYHFADETWRAAINPAVYTVHQFFFEVVNDYFVLGELTDYRD